MRKPDAMPREGCGRPISEPLLRASEELQSMTSEVEKLEHLISAVASGSGKIDRQTINELQNVDLLRQRIENVAIFMRLISEVCPEHWTVDAQGASQALKLSDLAVRLSGEAVDRRLNVSRDDDEIQLFSDIA